MRNKFVWNHSYLLYLILLLLDQKDKEICLWGCHSPCGSNCLWDLALPSLKMTVLARAECFSARFAAGLQGCFGVTIKKSVSNSEPEVNL